MGVGSTLLFAVFLVLYVVLPGMFVYRAFSPEPEGLLRQVAIGWALGYVLSVLAFMIAAAMGSREVFDFYPAIVAIPAAFVAWQRSGRSGPAILRPGPSDIPLAVIWFGVAVSVLSMAYAGIQFFSAGPLPGSGAVTYPQDFSWAIALASEALHHWPPMEPSVSGEPFPYHNFVHIHLASVAQVTGIDLPVVFLRLWILPVVLLTVLQCAEGGRSLAGSIRAGLLAAALLFLVGDFGLYPNGQFFLFITSSPSFTFGLIVFLPLLILVGERLRDRRPVTAAIPQWLLIAVFAFGAGGAKVSILPLFIGAVVLYAGWVWLREHRLSWPAFLAGAIFVAAQAAFYLVLYRGHASGLAPDLMAGIDLTKSVALIDGVKSQAIELLPGPDLIENVLAVIAVPVALFALLAPPLAGLVWLRSAGRGWAAWPLAILAVGLFFLLFIDSEASGNQLYFVYYGVTAGILVSARGIEVAWKERSELEGYGRRIAGLLAIWAIVVIGFVILPGELTDDPVREALYDYLWLAFAGLGLALLSLLLLKGSRRAIAVVLVGAVVMVGLIDTPTTSLKPALSQKTDPVGYRMTDDLYGALEWLKDETDVDSVFIVNNQQAINAGGFATAYDYPAFSERRSFLAGWGYANRTRDAGYGRVLAGFNPFADRQRLNDEAFNGDRTAIDTLKQDYGVRYALFDSVNGRTGSLDAIKPFGRVVYATPDAAIVDLGPPDDPG